jgi:ferrous iron transport protein A
MPTLDQLRPGEAATVEAVGGEPAVVQRLLELGLLEGERVELLTRAPLGDPLEIRVGPTRLSLRRREAACVTVRRADPAA